MKIEFYGYNDSKALAFYNSLKLLQVFAVCFIASIISIPFAIIFAVYELFYIFIIPGVFLLLIPLSYLINSKYKTFLKGQKTKHKFILDSGYLFKDNKVIKSFDDIKLYRFKKFLFLVLSRSYYKISNSDFILGSREEFLDLCNFSHYGKHKVIFDLPKKTEDEIVDFLFNSEINELKGERSFYSLDKRRILTISRNDVGSYSLHRYVVDIYDAEERMYIHRYGCYVPDSSDRASFYGTIDEALNDIKLEVKDYVELNKK